MRFSGTNKGGMFGRAPTGHRVDWMGSAHFRFKDDLVEDLWVLGDVHGLLAQLDGDTDRFV